MEHLVGMAELETECLHPNYESSLLVYNLCKEIRNSNIYA
jgi:hypothetical protein